MFSCEFYEISKNTFSYRTPLVATSVISQIDWRKLDAPYELSFKSWVLMAELLKYETSIDWVLYWSHAKSDSVWKKNSLLFKMSLSPFYPVFGRPLLLSGMGRIVSFSIRSFKYHKYVFVDVSKNLGN